MKREGRIHERNSRGKQVSQHILQKGRHDKEVCDEAIDETFSESRKNVSLFEVHYKYLE